MTNNPNNYLVGTNYETTPANPLKDGHLIKNILVITMKTEEKYLVTGRNVIKSMEIKGKN